MVGNKMNISKIENHVYNLLCGTVSSNVFVGTLPTTIKKDWCDICLVTCDSIIYDNSAVGEGVVYVNLYARPLSNGTKNVAALNLMEEKLNEAIKVNHNATSTYRLSRRGTYSDYDKDNNLHFNIVELIIKIF